MSAGLARLSRIVALLPLAAAASAAPVTKSSNGTVTLLGPLTVLKRSDLDFGTLAVTTAGTALIDPVNGARTATGGVIPAGTGFHPATFTGTGNRNSVVNIRLPSKPTTVTRTGGAETMTVSNWTLDGKNNRKVPPSQTFDFAVGATLTVGANQTPGTYVGTFDVWVQYP
jgi:hypothetical protein